MASYHCTVKTGAKGCAAKHADYISRTGEYNKYKSRDDLEYSSSGNMPSWAKQNPAELWKAADQFERKNGTAYREIEVALPRELTREQRIDLVEDFVQKEFGDRHAYQYAIHNPKAAIDGNEQPHAHIMFCERINDGIERDPQQFFKRSNSKDPERGGAKKARFGETPGERKTALVELRSRWADVQNHSLERHGHESRVDHRSLKEQGIERAPEVHLGPVRLAKMDVEQVCAILERRNAERELSEAETEINSVIDLTSSLASVLEERERLREREQATLEIDDKEINQLIDSAFEEVNEYLDIEQLINQSVREYGDIYQQEQNRIAVERRNEMKRQENKVHYSPERNNKSTSPGWSR
ncbi:TPA: MobA/MobL family protein [Salmonella enterica subsp. diarizonae]|nr:MobA/MobL family protein [Salmonella enterica subsp. diarizonae]